MSLMRKGQRIARIVDVAVLDVNGKKSYHVRGKQITKRLFSDLVWYAVDYDCLRTIVHGSRIVSSKSLYIPEYNNGGVLDKLEQAGVKWN